MDNNHSNFEDELNTLLQEFEHPSQKATIILNNLNDLIKDIKEFNEEFDFILHQAETLSRKEFHQFMIQVLDQ